MGILGHFFGGAGRENARVIGHRGLAAGSIQGRIAAGKQSRGARVERMPKVFLAPGVSVEGRAFTDTERAWHQLAGPLEVEGFVYEQQPMSVHSTNVLLAQYSARDNKLMVEFRNGGAGIYSNVSPREAIAFAQAGSKGRFVWQHLRRAGKPYARIK